MLAASVVGFLVVLHAASLVLRLLPDRIPDGLPEVVRPLGKRMERIARWDMFKSLFEEEQLIVEGSGRTGPWFDLANPFVRGLHLWSRIVDARLRKFHGRLHGPRRLDRWGRPYLAYLCRAGKAEHPELYQARVVRLVPPAVDDEGVETRGPKRWVSLRYRCGDPVEVRRRARPSRRDRDIELERDDL